MALDGKQQEPLLRVMYPGLIESVSALGPGEFVPECPVLRSKELRLPTGREVGLCAITIHLTYRFRDRDRLEIRLGCELRDPSAAWLMATAFVLADWKRHYYRLHYGTGTADNVVFRFDLTRARGHHVHLRAHPKEHIPTTDVVPDVTDLDPRRFVEMVSAYRAKRTHPVQKKSN